MTVNIPLLRKAVEFVEASAALHGADPVDDAYDKTGLGAIWYQGDWSALVNEDLARKQFTTQGQVDLETCGTAYCVAGYVTSLEPGYKAEIWINSDNDPVLRETINGSGNFYHSEVAQKALGLTLEQAERLFAGGNTAQKIRLLAESFAGEPL